MQDNNQEYCMIMTTCSAEATSHKIITTLLEKKLAACIQTIPIRSYYTWKGQVNLAEENLLLIKSRMILIEKIQQCILDLHDYEIPEIIVMPITDGHPEYLNWIGTVTK